MTIIRGGPAGPNGVGGSYINEVETDRSITWWGNGGKQGILSGFTHAAVAGLMALDFTPGGALVGERAADGTASLARGYWVWSDVTTRVTFGVASPSARNDAVVAAFVDTEDGPVGTGALTVGPHLVVVPGTSGVTTAVSDAAITAFLGRGGWVRLMDVPVAALATQINVATIVVTVASTINSSVNATHPSFVFNLGLTQYDAGNNALTLTTRGDVHTLQGLIRNATGASIAMTTGVPTILTGLQNAPGWVAPANDLNLVSTTQAQGLILRVILTKTGTVGVGRTPSATWSWGTSDYLYINFTWIA